MSGAWIGCVKRERGGGGGSEGEERIGCRTFRFERGVPRGVERSTWTIYSSTSWVRTHLPPPTLAPQPPRLFSSPCLPTIRVEILTYNHPPSSPYHLVPPEPPRVIDRDRDHDGTVMRWDAGTMMIGTWTKNPLSTRSPLRMISQRSRGTLIGSVRSLWGGVGELQVWGGRGVVVLIQSLLSWTFFDWGTME